MLLVGAGLGAGGLHYALSPRLGLPAVGPTPVPARPTGASANRRLFVADGPLPLHAAPGDDLVTTWVVSNAGALPIAVDEYRFLPADARLPAITLPRSLKAGARLMIRVEWVVPAVQMPWTARWVLTGQRGVVESGVLEAVVLGIRRP